MTPRLLRFFMAFILTVHTSFALAHNKAGALLPPAAIQHRLVFPDTENFRVLSADLHTHSVFSDGHVWPNIRVAEALRENLDVIAITEHLEWTPHSADQKVVDNNRAFHIAKAASKGEAILVLPGAEITRETPVGHINAIFINDANELVKAVQVEEGDDAAIDDYPDWGTEREVYVYYDQTGRWPAENAVIAALSQGAFLFWNHPSWIDQTPDGIPVVTPQHEKWFKGGWVQGIEVVNSEWYSPESFQLALDHNLTLIGTSDVHDLIDWDYQLHTGGHRPVTLILAESETEQGVKEALLARRTAVWHKNNLLGREKELQQLVEASLDITDVAFVEQSSLVRFTLTNGANMPFTLEYSESYPRIQSHARLIEVPALGQVTVELFLDEREKGFSWPVKVMNALTSPKELLSVSLDVTL